ncbi:glycerophosphocholine acyltransferase 1 [Cryptomeria japonica]|uniref:glycerophosphocholine acyltransferase 1 n=1 Tax=Cryptomeria japonica TaxID=3369 RepID=UPI0025ABCD18|nr:glycerophosphocholine acyltransferase 1 [Cryptomeria japonica]
MDDPYKTESSRPRSRIGVNIRPRVVLNTKSILSKQAKKIAKQAEEHECFINKVTHFCGVLGFGTFCFLLGSRPQDIPYLYCGLLFVMIPLRWIYYKFKKLHYYLLDFCYYANCIFVITILIFPSNKKLFMVCFSFAEGPLAWAIIVWRCSLVFSSFDKILSVLIHLLPGIVFFVIRWTSSVPFVDAHQTTGLGLLWPTVDDEASLWSWLFFVPLIAYGVWQVFYILIVNVLRYQRLLKDPEVITSFRELSKKAHNANNVWWRLSGLLGDQNRVVMYVAFQAAFTIATMALTVPIFKSYKMHAAFEILKVSATVWNGGNYVIEVMPRQVAVKEKKKIEVQQPSDRKIPSVSITDDVSNGNANKSSDMTK